jgi:hypothetical protein
MVPLRVDGKLRLLLVKPLPGLFEASIDVLQLRECFLAEGAMSLEAGDQAILVVTRFFDNIEPEE